MAAKAKAVAAKMPSMRKTPKTQAEEASYTVGSLAKLAGVTVRALRHYEDEGLLHPERTASGYRCYGAADVERLQQILLLRSCGLSLGDIRVALDNGDFDFHAGARQSSCHIARAAKGIGNPGGNGGEDHRVPGRKMHYD